MQNTQPLPTVNTVAALVGNNRLEPRPRTEEFNRSLRAEVRDATWMLARQWQMREFRAEDRGVPAYAEITVDTAPITQFKKNTGSARPYAGYTLPTAALGDPQGVLQPSLPDDEAIRFAGPLPLEAEVEAQPFAITPGLRLEMGEAWVRLLRKNGQGQYVGPFRQQYAMAAKTEATAGYDLPFALEQTTGEVHQLLQLLGAKAMDGYRLYAELVTNYRPALAVTGLSETGQSAAYAALKQTAEQFVASFGRLYFSQFNNNPGFEATLPTGWSISDLSYRFSVAVPTPDTGPLVLTANEHTAHSLEWYSMDERTGTGTAGFSNLPDKVRQTTKRFTPTVLRFPGAPNARWWEFEDRQVDFGMLTGDASDLGRMLLQEFMFVYQKDWFSLPYSVPVGSLSTVQTLRIKDVFGQTYAIQPAGSSDLIEENGKAVDNDEGRWNMFGLSQQGSRRAVVPRIFVPAAAVAPLVGKPVEQVLFRREEATNMVWGIEQLIPDGLSRGMDGTAAATKLTQYLKNHAQPLPSAIDARYRYQLATGVAENWIPFLPRPSPNAQGTYRLLQGEMLRSIDGLALAASDQTVKPRTPLLQLGRPTDAYEVHERQVPPVGVRIESAFRRARWFDGRIALWYARGRSTGYATSNGSSDLTFDELLPQPTPPIAASPIAWYQAGVGTSYNASGNLTEWRDLSGNGLHLTPNNSFGSTTKSPENMNGHELVRAYALASTQNCGITGNSGRTVYVLGRALQSQGTAFVSSGSPNTGQLFECAAVNGELLLHCWGAGQDNLGHLAPQPVTTPALFAWRYDGDGHSYCDFNGQRGTAGGPATINTTNSPLNLAYGAYYLSRQVDFLEVIVYNRFLTPAEDEQVRAYLGQKGNVPV